MADQALSHDDYTVAWVYALEVEQIPAILMLDVEHNPLPQPPNDHNVYTLGSINGHNVVIAGLPIVGNCPVATIIAQMRNTFHNLRFGLLVGIGGGIPTTTDQGPLRLGHVVVSKPSGTTSGVIQYDYGKVEAGRQIHRTGVLAPPPPVLLNSAQRVSVTRITAREDPLVRHLRRIDTSLEMLPEYKYPGREKDPLWDREVQGVRNSRFEALDDDGCPKWIAVHRGTIATGEMVVKNAEWRDRLSEAFGAICFEVEAAGTSADFPCLVIRGVSDYADEAKNDTWQPYAAASAAAYARELFFHMPVETLSPLVSNAYRDILESWEMPTQSTAMKLFRWMCFSQRPLTVREMLHAIGINPHLLISSTHTFGLTDLFDSDEDPTRLISDISKGFATVIPGRDVDGNDDNGKEADIVAFVHSSVREGVLARAFESTSSKALAHLDLATSSFCYIQLVELQERLAGFYEDKQMSGLEEDFPLLKYATQHCSAHTRLASELGSDLDGLVEIIARGHDFTRRRPSEEFHPFDKDMNSAVRDAFVGPNSLATENGALSTWFKASALWPSLRTNFFWPNPGTTVVHFLAKNDLWSLLSNVGMSDNLDWDGQDQYGRTPLSWAAEYAGVKTVELLLERGANIWKRDLCGETPFSWSAWRGDVNVARALLPEEVHADINSHNLLRQTPLCLAVQGEHVEMVNFLLEKNPEIDLRDLNGRTPLSWAAESGNVELVKSLLEKGANPHTADEQDRTPLDYIGNITDGHEAKNKLQHILEESVIQYKDWERRLEKDAEISMGDFTSTYSQEQEDFGWGSESSDSESMWSSRPSSMSSKTSVGHTQEDYRDATRRLADEFSKRPGMPKLYEKAIGKFGREMFAELHDRLLKRFFQELNSQATDETEKYVVRTFRQKQRRDEVTRLIQERFVPTIQHTKPAENEKSKMRSYPMWRQLDTKSHERYLDDDHWRDASSLKEIPERMPGVAEVDISDEEEGVIEDEQKDADTRYASQEQASGKFTESDVAKALQFLTRGVSFTHFQKRLELLVDPSQTIKQALERQDSSGLRRLLKHRFRSVTEGDYHWLRELDAVGYSCDAMAQLLLEAAADAPWIVFKPHGFVNSKPTVPFHHPRCVHHSIDDPSSEVAGPRTWTSELHVANTVQELCGLGGILPISQDREEWIGRCSFQKDDNSVAFLTYDMSSDADISHRHIILRILRVLESFCTATAYLQETGLCCDSFTIIRKSKCAQDSRELELVRVGFDMPLSLCEEVRNLETSTTLTTENVQPCFRIATNIIKLLDTPLVDPVPPESAVISTFPSSHTAQLAVKSSESYQQQNLDSAFHICALAAQLLCVGLASFLQAHVGYFEPFFLNAELKEMLLLGTVSLPEAEEQSHILPDLPIVRVDLNELTCLSGMTGGPVLAFNVVSQQSEELSQLEPVPQEAHHHDLVCRIDELLETWGPGLYIPSMEDANELKAVELREGLIYAVEANHNKFHWQPRTVNEDVSSLPSFCRNMKMIIGALVTENPDCIIPEQEWHRRRENCSLIPLGVYRAYWKVGERQGGGQVGFSYLMASANQTSIKDDGRSIKSMQMEKTERTDLLEFLGCSWGLQVSYCTGVARRVPLKALMADLLPVFAKAFKQQSILQDWIHTHDILNRLRTDDLQDLMHDLRNQDESMDQSLIRYMQTILDVLRSTGIDKTKKNLIISWPHEKELRRGLKIPCENESVWALILTDSHQCATFAYITDKCLVSDSTPCKGDDRRWLGKTDIMETAVSCYSVREEPIMRALEDGKQYHIKTLDSFVVLKAQKDQQVVRLMVSKSAVPREMRKALLLKTWIQGKNTHIREKQMPGDRAEQVLVSTG